MAAKELSEQTTKVAAGANKRKPTAELPSLSSPSPTRKSPSGGKQRAAPRMTPVSAAPFSPAPRAAPTYRMVVCGATAGTLSSMRCMQRTVVRKQRQRLGHHTLPRWSGGGGAGGCCGEASGKRSSSNPQHNPGRLPAMPPSARETARGRRGAAAANLALSD